MPPETDDKTALAAAKPGRRLNARAALEGFGDDNPDFEPRWERTPLYRVIEIVRDGDGRLRTEGRIWHTDLDHLRRFGRAMASNAVSHKVLIADSRGDVIEELSIVPHDRRETVWSDWQDMPLPPRPVVQRNLKSRRPATVPLPIPLPILAEPFFPIDETSAPAAEVALPVITEEVALPVITEEVALPVVTDEVMLPVMTDAVSDDINLMASIEVLLP